MSNKNIKVYALVEQVIHRFFNAVRIQLSSGSVIVSPRIFFNERMRKKRHTTFPCAKEGFAFFSDKIYLKRLERVFG